MNKVSSASRSKLHYGWVIAVCCMFISGGGIGILVNTLGIFIKPVSTSLGLPRAEFSLVTSLSSFATMLTYSYWGRHIAKHSIRKTMIVTGALMSLLIVMYSFCTQTWQFYVCALLLGSMTGSMSILPVTTLINRWFDASRGTATGISSCGSGLAMFIIPAVSAIIVNYGWRKAYVFVGIMLFLLVEVVAVFFLRDQPEDKGLKAYGVGESAISSEKKLTGISLKEAKHTTSFKLVVFVAVISALCNTAITHHVYAYVSDLGFSAAFASIMSSLQMGAMMCSKLIIGVILDRVGMKIGLWISIFGYFMAAACLLAGKFAVAFVVAAVVCAGIGAAMPAMSVAYSLRRLYGSKEYSTIAGFTLSFTFLGNTIGTSMSGAIYDATGNYDLSWIIIMASSVLMLVILSLALKAHAREGIEEKLVG